MSDTKREPAVLTKQALQGVKGAAKPIIPPISPKDPPFLDGPEHLLQGTRPKNAVGAQEAADVVAPPVTPVIRPKPNPELGAEAPLEPPSATPRQEESEES